jgi:hypothetical protein
MKLQYLAGHYCTTCHLFLFFSLFLKDFLKYAPDRKILGKRLRAWRHQRWRQDN